MTNPTEDYENIAKHIHKFESLSDNHRVTKATIDRYQKQLDKISSQYEYDDSIGYLYFSFYELQAYIYKELDDDVSAIKFLTEAADIKPNGQDFVSRAAQEWYDNELELAANASNEMYKKSVGSGRKYSKRTKIIFWSIVGVIVLLVIVSGPLSDYFTIKNANPTMIKLAQDAGMSRKGELIFLRTSPQLVSDSELAQMCPAAQTNNNGFIEQGCYVPNQSDPTTGRIYLRQMSSDLYNLEVTTAAYEMLHPVYISLAGSGTSASSLNTTIENNLTALSDNNLTAQVANFAKTEPGAKDLELFSILGTEYSGITTDLASYYSPYINDISSVVSLNNQVAQIFQNDQTQLTQLQSQINTAHNQANIAYADSVSWANVGNQYEDNRNYNIYTQDFTNENNLITQYNQLLDQYNVLVSEYNGQQFNADTPIQSQQSH